MNNKSFVLASQLVAACRTAPGAGGRAGARSRSGHARQGRGWARRQNACPARLSRDCQAHEDQRMVRLAVTVDPEGKVTDVKPLSGNTMLSIAASEAVRKWRFEPGSESTEEIALNFSL